MATWSRWLLALICMLCFPTLVGATPACVLPRRFFTQLTIDPAALPPQIEAHITPSAISFNNPTNHPVLLLVTGDSRLAAWGWLPKENYPLPPPATATSAISLTSNLVYIWQLDTEALSQATPSKTQSEVRFYHWTLMAEEGLHITSEPGMEHGLSIYALAADLTYFHPNGTEPPTANTIPTPQTSRLWFMTTTELFEVPVRIRYTINPNFANEPSNCITEPNPYFSNNLSIVGIGACLLAVFIVVVVSLGRLILPPSWPEV